MTAIFMEILSLKNLDNVSFPFNLKHEMINLDHSDQKFGSFSSKYWSDQDNID